MTAQGIALFALIAVIGAVAALVWAIAYLATKP